MRTTLGDLDNTCEDVIYKQRDIADNDMPTVVIVYRLSVYFSLCLTVSSLYLPEMTLNSHTRRTRTASLVSSSAAGRSRAVPMTSGRSRPPTDTISSIFTHTGSASTSSSASSSAAASASLNTANHDLRPQYRTYRSAEKDRSSFRKRSSVYNVFSKMMTRHANRHKNDKAFVDRMFSLFDLDGDRVIERREFKAVLQILGIVSHNF